MSLVWEGLDELQAMLRALPRQLREEGGRIVLDTAEAAAQEIYNAYPVKTGNLRDGLRIRQQNIGEFGAQATVVNVAKHAWIYEYGSQVRYTDSGAERGTMPPGHVFVPIMERRRRQMYFEDFAALLERAGFVVETEAA